MSASSDLEAACRPHPWLPPSVSLGALFAGLLLAGEAAGLAAQFDRNLPAFVALALLQGGIWAAAAIVMLRHPERRPRLALILAAAALMRVIALAAPVFLSDDVNRYVWDGRVQAAGINPYRYIPTDPALAALRDETIFPNINRNNYAPTIYPPVAQMLFLIAHALGGTVLAVKLLVVMIEAVGIGALMFVLRATGAPRQQILLYAWHPLPVWEIAGAGHIDAAVVAFTGLALASALAGRRASSGAALAAATLVKFFPVVLAPALWRPAKTKLGDWRWPAGFIAVVFAAYLPYIAAGWQVLGFLPGYVAEENLTSGGGLWLLDMARRVLAVPLAVYLAAAGAVMAGLAIGGWRQASQLRAICPWAAALAIVAMFFASPHYPWYFVWLVALLTAAPWWPGWWLTVVAVVLYCEPKTGRIPLWEGLTLYGGFVLLCAADIACRSYCRARFGTTHDIDRATSTRSATLLRSRRR